MSIDRAIKAMENFQGDSLTEKLASIEKSIVDFNSHESHQFCDKYAINNELMQSALSIKKVASQINVIIHATGILLSLSSILEKGEKVESVSLGAGNTGKKFDLETNIRVAEFKFIDWKGGSESIRQNGIFKDFYSLAEYEGDKRDKRDKKKILYVVDLRYPLKFFNGGRALTSVLSNQQEILKKITEKYDNKLNKVSDYYNIHKHQVEICDVRQYIGRST